MPTSTSAIRHREIHVSRPEVGVCDLQASAPTWSDARLCVTTLSLTMTSLALTLNTPHDKISRSETLQDTMT
jgi:hypothetical protein